MNKVKKYSWRIITCVGEQLIKYKQDSFYMGDIDIEDIKVSKYPSGFNLSHEDMNKLDNGESIEVETTYTKKFIITKDD